MRSAVLLGCSLPEAEDLVQATLERCYVKWAAVERAEHRDAYVAQVLLNCLRQSRRRRWWGERPTAELPDTVLPDGTEVVNDTVDERPAPVDALVSSGRRRLGQRRIRTLALGTAAALAAVSTVSAVRTAHDPDRPVPVVEATEAPVPPPGTRYVGRGDVVVAVPKSWATFTEAVCAQPTTDYVRFAPKYTGYRCPDVVTPDEADLSGVTIASSEPICLGCGLVPDDDRGYGIVHCVDGRHAHCWATVWRPEDKVYLDLLDYSEDARHVVQTAVDSVQVLPDGWTTVPYVETRNFTYPSLVSVQRALRAADFERRSDEPGNDGPQ